MKPTDTLTASENAEWVYCQEAWSLARTGAKPTLQARAIRAEGTVRHVGKATVEIVASESLNQAAA